MRKITIVFFFLMTITLLACGGTNPEMPSLPREEPGPSYGSCESDHRILSKLGAQST